MKLMLISESHMHYRKSLYNEFYKIFNNYGYELIVYTDDKFSTSNDNVNICDYRLLKDNYNFRNIFRFIKQEKPSYIIIFWNIYSITTWLLILYLKFKNLHFVYWSQGYSMLNPENRIKGLLYKTVHTLSDTILLYSRNETKYISKKHHNKVFVANNTINFKTIPTIIESKEELKIKYKIPFKKVLLFVGRIQKRKRLDILVDYFSTLDHSDYGLVIVGKNIPEELFEKIKYSKNIIYFGEVYKDIDDFFKLSDIFCIPGTNGLGINHAMFWGLPVLTLNVKHNPEIFYLKNGINGYILDTPIDLFDKIKELFENEKEQKRLSINAYKIIREEASIEVMAKGFIDSLNYLKRKKE